MALGIDDAALAMVLAGLVSTAGSLYTNRKNLDANDYANKVNWDIARQNNATQIEMANTAHQREVMDLRAAGLNPILSAGGNGSSVPTLSGATLQPLQQSNAFEGLANSAKGVARYISEEYKNKLTQQRANNALTLSQDEGIRIDNSLHRLDFDRNRNAFQAELDNLYSDQLEGAVRKVATMAETGLQMKEDEYGMWKPYIDDEGQFRSAVELEREGIRSDMKTRSNQNWRANLSSFVPFVSPTAINSARNATRATVPMFRRGIP